MKDINALKKFSDSFNNLMEEIKRIDEINYYFEDEVDLCLRFDRAKVNKITDNIYILKDIYDDISLFLSNQKFNDLVQKMSEENDNYNQQIAYLKDSRTKCGMLLEKYEKIVNASSGAFNDYLANVKRNNIRSIKYEDYLKKQYRAAFDYPKDKLFTSTELINWSIQNNIVGSKLVNHLKIYQKAYDIKPAEMHKGLYDSIFTLKESPEHWSIITPYADMFAGRDNTYKGRLIYECGLQIRDGYKTDNLRHSIDTIVLYNPYNDEDVNTLINAANDMNVVYSIFGYNNDCNIDNKNEEYYSTLERLRKVDGSIIDQTIHQDDKCYVKTIFSKKNK